MSVTSAGFATRLTSMLGGPAARRLAQWKLVLPQIERFEPELMALADDQLRKRSLSLRYRAKSHEPLSQLLPEAFALVRESGRRRLNMRHFDVQMLGGMALHNRSIAEMQTGEGKTLTATLGMYLNALSGKGSHLATVNDYLARRDAEWMTPLYEGLGMSVGIVESQMATPLRRKAYAADITYGTAKEFGFDFLRDRLLLRSTREGAADFLGAMLGVGAQGGNEDPVQRPPNFILVDEADSILIDEARTPLIISALPTEEERIAAECYQWAAGIVDQFVEDEHYEFEHDRQRLDLTSAGRQLARNLPKPETMDQVGMVAIYEYVERALKVRKVFHRDRQYVVRDGEIVIVDENTGRLAEGRKWRAGIHQSIEAAEGVEVTVATGQAARVTMQQYMLRYPALAGMTGTTANSDGELLRIYKLRVIHIPTNRPAIRQRLAERVYGTADQKWQAIVEEVREVHAQGRPVLIGTRTIDKSELLSKLLDAAHINHQVLNANKVAEEAAIVARAGEQGKVTVSTNMAGRGTDIRLGEGVEAMGGLHVISTELHESARIDRQLIGRCGRQGDPGTYRQYLGLDDEILLTGYGPTKFQRLKTRGESAQGDMPGYAKALRQAQHRVERRHFRERRVLMYFEKQRQKMHIQMGQDPYLDAAGD